MALLYTMRGLIHRNRVEPTCLSGVGRTFLSVVESVSGGHSCPSEPIRVCSAGQECPALADSTTDKNVRPTKSATGGSCDLSLIRPLKFHAIAIGIAGEESVDAGDLEASIPD